MVKTCKLFSSRNRGDRRGNSFAGSVFRGNLSKMRLIGGGNWKKSENDLLTVATGGWSPSDSSFLSGMTLTHPEISMLVQNMLCSPRYFLSVKCHVDRKIGGRRVVSEGPQLNESFVIHFESDGAGACLHLLKPIHTGRKFCWSRAQPGFLYQQNP